MKRRLWGIVICGIFSLIPPVKVTENLNADTGKECSICVVDKNSPRAVIVIPNDSEGRKVTKPQPPWIRFQNYTLWNSSSRESADLLSDYVFKSTFARLPVVKESEIPPGKNEIHVGKTEFVRKLDLPITKMDADGLLIKIISPKRVVLVGGSDLGTEYAVYEFLERYLGVRWLFPGELGEHVPKKNSLTVTGPDIKEEPKFYSRRFKVGHDCRMDRLRGDGRTWDRRNRIHSRIEFHHNIPKLIDTSFIITHPEYFPLIDGKRKFPPNNNYPHWHLCYSANGLAETLADKLNRFFAKNPEYTSVSLGVSDGDANCYCHCESCLKKQGNKTNSLGYHHYSDMYYNWCNQVVSKVAESFPEKRFGCLAYREVTDPPDKVKLHKRLIPYMCYELLQWAEPKRRELFKRNYSKWIKRANQLGVYDYVFGNDFYHVPRVYFHLMADYIRYLSENGTIGYNAEASGYSSEGVRFTGPQMYLLARLLWNPELDADTLLKDWYECAVGVKAAPFLAEHFAIWEDYWTNRVRETDWYGNKSFIHSNFPHPGYLEAVKKEDIGRSLSLLKKVVENAGSGAQKQRAKLIYTDFKKEADNVLYQIRMRDSRRKKMGMTGEDKVVLQQNFSDGIGRWRSVSSKNREKQWDPERGKEKKGSLKVGRKSNLVLNDFKVTPGKKYLLEFYAKASGLSDCAKLRMIFNWKDKNKDKSKMKPYKLFLDVEREKLLGDDWVKIQIPFFPPSTPGVAEAYSVDIQINRFWKGNAWIDDLKITELSSATAH